MTAVNFDIQWRRAWSKMFLGLCTCFFTLKYSLKYTLSILATFVLVLAVKLESRNFMKVRLKFLKIRYIFIFF